MRLYLSLSLFLLFFFTLRVQAQDSNILQPIPTVYSHDLASLVSITNETNQDSLSLKPIVGEPVRQVPSRKNSFLYYPSLGYQPEIGVQFGLHGIFYFDMDKKDTVSRRLKFDSRAFYTTKNQFYTYDLFQIFTKDEKYNINGWLQGGYWNDRFYPIGNRPTHKIVEFFPSGADTVNYFNYSYQFVNFYTVLDRKINDNLFAGLMVEYDRSGQNQILADSLNRNENKLLSRNEATRTGLGGNINYDSRDNCDNPLKGAYIQVVGGLYRKAFGGSSNYHLVTMDADKYINTFKDQTLALRLVLEYRKADNAGEPIPIRGLSYNGGISSLRGYFSGTYRDNNLLAVETEYRLPINIHENAPFWKFWERMGVVAFFSGVRVNSQFQKLFASSTIDYHYAGGVGLRYMINMKQRLNATLDYAVGLDKNAGAGQRPTGFYFSLGEAF